MKLVCLFAVVISSLTGLSAQALNPTPSPWDRPAAALADQVAVILGPGQAHLIIRNLSNVSTDQIPSIRRQLVQGLKTHGVIASGAESANILRVTLSENSRERLWVAEIIEGDETRIAMVRVDGAIEKPLPAQDRIVLRKEPYLTSAELSSPPWTVGSPTGEPVLAIAETVNELIVLKQDHLFIFGMTTIGWREQREFDLGEHRALARDPRGILLTSAGGNGFSIFTGGSECVGSYVSQANQATRSADGWSVNCHESDDPWPFVPAEQSSGAVPLKAFYNAARNCFTGVINGSPGVDLPPFYSAAQIVRSASSVPLLIGGIDGKVQILENGKLKSITGARDWGSDFAALRSGCGAGTQIIASGSGAAPSDSLRAYELPAQEAIPVSAALAMDGAVTALAASPDGKSVIAVVRTAANQYEVDRVTASCN